MKRPNIQCPQCMGHGEIPLSASMLSTLNFVKQHHCKRGITAQEIHQDCKDRIGITAINNRLVFLEKAGLVRRDEKFGKNWLWKVKT